MAVPDRRDVARQVEDLVIVPDLGAVMDRRIAWGNVLYAHDADRECEHGRIEGDSTPPCGCWASERPRLRVVACAAPAPREPRVQTLTCSTCEAVWTRLARRGRPPKQCPECGGHA